MNYSKQYISVFIVVVFAFGLIPTPTMALFGNGDTVLEVGPQLHTNIKTTIEQTLSTITKKMSLIEEKMKTVKEYVLDPAAWAISKAQIHSEANTILEQIRGNRGSARGETGGALFVTDWLTVARRAARNQNNYFLDELAATQKIDPAFKGTLLQALSANPERSVFNRARSTFQEDTGYELGAFTQDFSKGGWQGWNSIVTTPGNNPYSTYLMLEEERRQRVNNATQARINEALASSGALGTQQCVEETSPESDFVGPPDPGLEGPPDPGLEGPTIQKCKITRPGESVINDLSKTLGGPTDTAQQVDELSELVLGALQAVVSTMRATGISWDDEESDPVEDSRNRLTEENRTITESSIRELADTVDRAISDIDTIWQIKVKSLDAIDEINPGLVYEINATINDIRFGGKCAQNTTLVSSINDDLDDALSLRDKLAREVGVPVDFSNPLNGDGPTIGDLENGGSFSQTLFTKQADLEYLKEIVANSGRDPSVAASEGLVQKFVGNLSNQQRINIARQQIAAEVGRVQSLLLQMGDVSSARAELQRIKSDQSGQREARATCYFQY